MHRIEQVYAEGRADFKNKIFVNLSPIRFDDDQMVSKWYDGRHKLHSFRIVTRRLTAIHTNAFSGFAFNLLHSLEIRAESGLLKIYDGIFFPMESLEEWQFHGIVVQIPLGLFDAFANTMYCIQFDGWPSETRLGEMFANEIYRQLQILSIVNVRWPQTELRHLVAADFSSFRSLAQLHLINCGIEVIDENAFDAIGHTLVEIDLEGNNIQFISVEMFRVFFESSHWDLFCIGESMLKVQCTCELLELDVLQCPFRVSSDLCVDCDSRDFVPMNCKRYTEIDVAKFRTPQDVDTYLRIITLRMAFHGDSLHIHTNFSSKVRVLFVNMDDFDHMDGGKCHARAAQSNYRCLSFRKFTNPINLMAIGGLRHAELVSITAIPFLYHNGAKPLHLIMARRDIASEHLRSMECIFIAFFACFLGLLVGVGIALYRNRDIIFGIKNQTDVDRVGVPDEYIYYNRIELSHVIGDSVEYESYELYEPKPNGDTVRYVENEQIQSICFNIRHDFR